MRSAAMSAAATEALKTSRTRRPMKSTPTLLTRPRSLDPTFGQNTFALAATRTET